MAMFLATGCSKVNDITESVENTKVVLTTGFESDEIFRLEKESCSLAEIMVYLTNTQNQYKNSFGSEILNTTFDGESLEGNIKETVLARIARIKSLNLMAQQYEIGLDEDELEKASKAAAQYFASLNDSEKSLMGVSCELLEEMYQEYALAGKIYEYLIADINPEISDDEARTITVQHILIKTYSLNEAGERVPYSKQAKSEALSRAREALERAKGGEDFQSLIAEYSEDTNSSYTFGKGTLDEAFENAAFNLGTDEISGIVETEHGYHIIKCISNFNRDETDRNKVKLLEQRRKEVFNEEYTAFVKSLTKSLNNELWDSVGFITDEDVTTDSFFEVYKEQFIQ